MARSGGLEDPNKSLAGLPSLAPLPTVAERAAAVIRENIFEGRFQPGMALPETTLAQALQVSRNTVREAFRTLINEHLLIYEAHKGVSVRRLTTEDVHDIYAVRRMLELSALKKLADGRGTYDPATLDDSVTACERAAEEDNWLAVGTLNLRFHAQIVEIHGSSRMNEFFRQVITEMRLGFLAISQSADFYGPYQRRNREIVDQLISGDLENALNALAVYLDDAERQVAAAVTRSNE